MGKPNYKLVHAELKFGGERSVPRALPEFTIDDLIELGVTITQTEKTKLIEIPMSAQRKLVEVLKPCGFGVSKGLDELLRKILKTCGFDGKIETQCDEKFAFRAWQTNES